MEIEYVVHLLIMIGIYYILIASTHLLVGMTNLISLSQAAFFGVGAYISALCLLYFQLTMFPTLIFVFCINAVLAYIISKPTIRLKGDYFLLATIGFQLIIYSILYNWSNITKGTDGVTNIPSGEILGIINIEGVYSFFFLTVILSVMIFFLLHRIIDSPFGNALFALREDEVLFTSLGYNLVKYKTIAFVLSGGLSGWAGYLFASYLNYMGLAAQKDKISHFPKLKSL